jgi:hypothetical protein
VADTLVKPTDMGLPAVKLGQEPGKQTNQSVHRKIVCPPSSHPYAKKPIAQSSLTSKPLLEIELAEMDRACRKYQSINDRDAVYLRGRSSLF